MSVMGTREETTVEELAEYLAHLNNFAKRQPRVIALFANERPTSWDKAHRLMDGPLDDLLSARSALSTDVVA